MCLRLLHIAFHRLPLIGINESYTMKTADKCLRLLAFFFFETILELRRIMRKCLGCLHLFLLQEPDPCIGVCDDKRVSLLAMSFSLNEVEFAIGKLGM